MKQNEQLGTNMRRTVIKKQVRTSYLIKVSSKKPFLKTSPTIVCDLENVYTMILDVHILYIPNTTKGHLLFLWHHHDKMKCASTMPVCLLDVLGFHYQPFSLQKAMWYRSNRVHDVHRIQKHMIRVRDPKTHPKCFQNESRRHNLFRFDFCFVLPRYYAPQRYPTTSIVQREAAR